MVEELQESDVLWPDHDDDDWPSGEEYPDVHKEPSPRRRVSGSAGCQARPPTKPVRVPVPPHLSRSCVSYFMRGGGGGRDDCIDGNRRGGGMVITTPPHVVASRRMMMTTEKVAFSMCSGGRGRTLKGRDLQRLRDAVLMMTGVLET